MTTANVSVLGVQTEIEGQIAELSGPMLEVCRYATGGGRRTRARLLLGAAPSVEKRSLLAATALEMVHAATLLQDDIFDGGNLRRGCPAAHVRFGNPLTILASDWLLVRALEIAAEVDLSFFRCLAKAASSMAQAEAQEFTPLPIGSLGDAQHYGGEIARGKTAALFGTALCGAAVLWGLPPEQRIGWQHTGVEIGLTYQLVDDCVDVYGEEATAKKTLGHDLTAGCLTLPVVLAATSLERQGLPVSLELLRAGQLALRDRDRLEMEIRSPEVTVQLHKLLQSRFAEHRKEAAKAGIPAPAVEALQSGLQARLGPGLQRVAGSAGEDWTFAPGSFKLPAAWQGHA